MESSALQMISQLEEDDRAIMGLEFSELQKRSQKNTVILELPDQLPIC